MTKNKKYGQEDLFAAFREAIDILPYRALSPQAAASEVKRFRALLDQATSPTGLMQTAEKNFYPLHIAAKSGAHRLVELFLEKGAGVNTPQHHTLCDGETALHMAAEAPSRNLEIARMLIEAGADVHKRSSDGETPLVRAVKHNNAQLIDYLLECGSDINQNVRWGQTSLHWAALYAADDAVETLIRRGADTKARDDDGRTPFALSKTVKSARLFLDLGADANEKNAQGETLLHWACRNPMTEAKLIGLLISRRANVNAKTNKGETPLHWALTWRPEAVQALLEAGADPRIPGPDGKTCLEMVNAMMNPELSTLIQSALNGDLAEKREARRKAAFQQKLALIDKHCRTGRRFSP